MRKWLGCLAVVVGLLGVATDGLAAKQKTAAKPPEPKRLLILATGDEHGWLEPLTSKSAGTYQGGLAYVMGQLVAKEGYRPASTVLVSAGDMWTGPYESTVLMGRPVIQAMNTMGYDAAAIGNHDFDFGQETIQRRATEASFPFLAANLFVAGKSTQPSYVKPFTVTDAAGIKVGLVGLVTEETLITTDRRNLEGLTFEPLSQALRRTVPLVREAGATVVMVLAHASPEEMRPLIPLLRQLGVNVVICGHEHHSDLHVDQGDLSTAADDVVLCNPGPYARSYCRLELTLDGLTWTVQSHVEAVEPVMGRTAAPVHPAHDGLMGLVAEARSQAEAKGAEVLATVPQGLHREMPVHTLGYLTLDAWLLAVPHADFAVTNTGGFRQDVEGGPVRMKDLIGAMPFDNYLFVVRLTGAQLVEVMENTQSIPAGLTVEMNVDAVGKRTVTRLLDTKGIALEAAKVYRVVINDFMYRGGDRYRFKEYDPKPEETAIHWREPLVRLLRQTSQGRQPVPVSTVSRFKVVR